MKGARSFDDLWIGEPNSGCWLWIGSAHKSKTHVYGEMAKVKAHRISYAMHKGPIPEGMVVMHKCDTPLCVNPLHLKMGTVAENNADMCAKGRQRVGATFAIGEANSRAKITAENVIEIRQSDRKNEELAAHFGISASHVKNIRNGQSWKHVA